ARDVGLMDIQIATRDGGAATRQLCSPERVGRREHTPHLVTPTACNGNGRAANASRYGDRGLLHKDKTPYQLADAIRSVHPRHAELAAEDLSTLMGSQFLNATPVPEEYRDVSEREQEVFAAVARGLSNQEIGKELFASESTVKTHVGAIL